MASTLLQLRVRILGYLNDLQDATTGTGARFQNVIINQTVNDSTKHYGKIMSANYQGYLNTNYSLDILANVNSYLLPSSFRSPIYEARRVINQTDFFLDPQHTYNSILDTTPVSNQEWIPTYHLEGNTIVFNQIPALAETAAVTIKYQMKIPDLVNDSDALDDQLYELEDCIVLKSVIRLLKAKDVSGGLKVIAGWDAELQESQSTLYLQVGNRYLKHDHPIPTSNQDNYLF